MFMKKSIKRHRNAVQNLIRKKKKKTYFEEKKGKNTISKKNLEKQLEQLVLTEIRSPCTDSRASISEKTKQKAYYLSKNRN